MSLGNDIHGGTYVGDGTSVEGEQRSEFREGREEIVDDMVGCDMGMRPVEEDITPANDLESKFIPLTENEVGVRETFGSENAKTNQAPTDDHVSKVVPFTVNEAIVDETKKRDLRVKMTIKASNW